MDIREKRLEIAATIMAGILANPNYQGTMEYTCKRALALADELAKDSLLMGKEENEQWGQMQ